MDKSIEGFFTKNAADKYAQQYRLDHGPRLDWLLKEFKVNPSNKRIADVGGGLGFLGEKLDQTNKYHVFDGAKFPEELRLVKGEWHHADLSYDTFSKCSYFEDGVCSDVGKFDYVFCLETLEHLSNPYHCLYEIKKLAKEDAEIYISIPHANVTHNYIYPALMISRENFQQFLDQMALPTIEYKLWDKGWNAHTWKLRNAPWKDVRMLYPKYEQKFVGKTPLEYVNL